MVLAKECVHQNYAFYYICLSSTSDLFEYFFKSSEDVYCEKKEVDNIATGHQQTVKVFPKIVKL